MHSPIITADNLAKTYLIYATPRDRLWQMIFGRWKRYYEPFEALKPLSFSIEPGETVGIVGRNGSGKSTLLQMLAGTLTPTGGSLKVEGKVAALLELGAGFNPEFSGRENVYLNGSILGMTQAEIDAAYDGILAFAGIGEFIHRPVSTYSSGMVVRLAFSVATASRPDVLIVDEALSVGDEAFQRKCFARIEAMREAGTTVLFVSHSAQTVIQLCDRAIWLDQGVLRMDGAPKAVIDAYHVALHAAQSSVVSHQSSVEGRESTPHPNPETREIGGHPPISRALSPQGERELKTLSPWGRGRHEVPGEGMGATTTIQLSESLKEYPANGGRISKPRLTDAAGEPVRTLEHGGRYRFAYTMTLEAAATHLRAGMLLKTRTGVEAAGAVIHAKEHGRAALNAGDVVEIAFEFTCLLYPGSYFLNAGVMAEVDGEERYLHRLVDAAELKILNPTGRNSGGVSPEGLVDLQFSGMFK